MNWFRIFGIVCSLPIAAIWGSVKICLALTVGDEGGDLKRSLESVQGIVDCVAVSDIGTVSEVDSNLAVVEEFLAETGIPGAIYGTEQGSQEQFRGLEAAKRLIQELHFSFQDTYILFLEPGTALKASNSFEKDTLEDDSYLLLEKSAPQSCYQYNLRLVRAAALDGFLEFLSNPIVYQAPPFSPKLPTLMIEKDASIERSEQDLTQLLQASKQDPQNRKTLFTLAQLQRGLNRFNEAIRFYQARIALGGGGDEIWFSKYKVGECYQEMGDWDQAFAWYLDAYQANPSRAEPLLKIASHFRETGKNDIAYLFAKHGSKIPFPENTNLFPFLCNYQFDEELSITAYYTRFREEGFQHACDLILKRFVPGAVRDQTYRNLLFYVPKLKDVRYQSIQFDLPLIAEGSDERYHPMNPSIAKFKDGYKVICRGVSYTQTGAKHFHTNDPKGIYRSLNYLLSYDRNFRLLSQVQVQENLERERIPSFLLEGMEDCRIFEYGKSLWYTCTCFDTNPTGNLQISLCKLRDRTDGKIVAVEKLTPLLGPDPYRYEKNWLPFVKDGVVHAIYSYDPFIVYRPNLQTGECETVVYYKPSHEFSRFRGSAAPIEFDDGYLVMVHEVVFMPEFERCYLHRFLYLDRDFQVQLLSKPFIFDHCGVEFCCGMTRDHSGKQIVMAIGLEDKEARLGFVDCETIRSLLEPLPAVVNYPISE